MDIERLEDRAHELVNAERIDRRLSPMEHVREIRWIARSHSDDMATRDYFSHTSPEGLTTTDRVDRAGYDSRIREGEGIHDAELLLIAFSPGRERFARFVIRRAVAEKRGRRDQTRVD